MFQASLQCSPQLESGKVARSISSSSSHPASLSALCPGPSASLVRLVFWKSPCRRMPVRGFLGAAMMANLPCSTPTANIRIHSSSRQRRKPSWLSVAGVAATLLLVMSTTAAASTSGDLPLDDEFRTDPFFSAEASVPTAGRCAQQYQCINTAAHSSILVGPHHIYQLLP